MDLVIGYGNPLRGDDGAGWRVVEMLAESLPEGTIIAVHQLTPEWAEPISRAGRVVFVDAAATGEPGEVRSFSLAGVASRSGTHALTAEGLLAMASELFGRCPPAEMVTIAGDRFELSERLSAPVAAAVPVAARLVLALLGVTAESP